MSQESRFSALLLGAGLLCAGGAGAESLRLAVTDLSGLEMLLAEYEAFRAVLSEASGYEVEFFPVSSRTAAVESLRTSRVDFVLTGPAEYVVIRKLTEARPVVAFSRPDYYSGLVVMATGGIQSVEDLRGKNVAFGDVGSTSDHLAPAQLLADAGLDPQSDVKPKHVGRNVAWEALKRGDVAAVGLGYRKFLRVRDREGELPAGSFRVIARGRDLPSDVLVAGAHVDAAQLERVRKAFVESSDELVAAMLAGEESQKYRGMQFLPDVRDRDYDYIREMYRTIGRPRFAEFVGD
jgi:phosphonate transport system substrate-binding protein